MQGLDDIAVFIKVIQAGSFTQAARLLSMPNTTVSAKVAALEKRLGVTLIRRTTRKLSVTQAGEAYFKRCLIALEEIQVAEAEITSTQVVPQGLFRITAPVDIGQTLLRPILHAFLASYSKVTVELILTNRLVDLVEEGVDLALRVGNLKDSTLIAKKFVEAPIGLWASPSYLKKNGFPHHPRELKNHEFIRFSAMGSPLDLSNGNEKTQIELHGRLAIDDLETVKSYVADGKGLGLFPQFLCTSEEERGKLVSVLPAWNHGVAVVSFVYPPQRFVSVSTQAFIEVARRAQRARSRN